MYTVCVTVLLWMTSLKYNHSTLPRWTCLGLMVSWDSALNKEQSHANRAVALRAVDYELSHLSCTNVDLE